MLTGQPGGDGGAPPRLPGAVRRRIHVERRRTHPAAHVGRILSGGDDPARSLQVVGRRPGRERAASRPVRCRGAAARMAASSSAGAALVIWAAAVDPADVPMIRSASVTSSPASDRPAMTPISQALPADPPPWRTSARSPAAGEEVRKLKKVSCSWESPFAKLPGGRSRWRLPQSRDRGRQGSTHCGYCVHGSHLLPTDHDQPER